MQTTISWILGKATVAVVATVIAVTYATAQQPLVGRSSSPRTPAVTGLYTGSQSGWAIYGSASAGYAGYFLGHGYFSRSLILAASPPSSLANLTARLLVDGDAVVTGAFTVGGFSQFNENVVIGNGVPRQLTVTGNTTIGGVFTANNNAQFNGNVAIGSNGNARQLTVTGNTAVGGALSVSGTTTFNSTLIVGGASQFNQALTVQGALTANNNAQFNGNVAIGSNGNARQLTVTGTASVSGNTAVGGTLTVSGATNLNNTLDVAGATTLGNRLTVQGATNLNNTLAVAGATSLGNRLTVQGVTNLNNTLDVAGATTLGNTLTVQGLLTANADAQFNGNVTVGTAEAPRQVRVNGNLVAPGAGINTPTFVFIHQYTGEEASPQTELNHPLLNGNPTAIILVTYNATGSGSPIPLNSSVGVRYDPGTERWYIYTLSGGNDIQPNATFNVMIVTTN
jgi:predicted acyltransferase (DUF342 family)